MGDHERPHALCPELQQQHVDRRAVAGSSPLVRSSFTIPPDRKDDEPDEWEAVEIVLRLIEGAQMASGMRTHPN